MPRRAAPSVTVYMRPYGGPSPIGPGGLPMPQPPSMPMQPAIGFRPLAIERSCGGGSHDRCTLAVDFDALNTRLVNMGLADNSNFEVAVVAQVGALTQPLHWGKTSVSEVFVGGSGEGALLTSRIEDFHFGGIRLYGMVEFDTASGQALTNAAELVFNPLIDGVVYPNQSSRRFGGASVAYFVDPESLRTTRAAQLQGNPTVSRWTLAEAVHYVCWVLNPNQQYLNNPSVANLQATLGTSQSYLTNHGLRHGMFLPECLDSLLSPYGFGWYVKLSGGVAGQITRQITVFRRGAGPTRSVALQIPGQQLDTSQSNCPEFRVGFHVGTTANQVSVLGGFHQVESTWTLKPAWNSSRASLTLDQLSKDHADYAANPEYRRVWRDWVLNEAGDYNGLGYHTAAANLASVFGYPLTARRRVFEPTLTQGYDLAPIGEFAGTHVSVSTDGGTTWKYAVDLEDCDVTLLDRECGVRFDGILPPIELYEAGANAQVRITASIRSDRRLTYTTPASGTSPQGDVANVLLDLEGRFAWRVIHTASEYYALVQAGQYQSLAANDLAALTQLANDLLASWNMADVGGSLVLEGLDGTQYELADLITGVVGRGIDFDGGGSGGSVYPQVIGQTWYPEQQRRVLHISTHRNRMV